MKNKYTVFVEWKRGHTGMYGCESREQAEDIVQILQNRCSDVVSKCYKVANRPAAVNPLLKRKEKKDDSRTVLAE